MVQELKPELNATAQNILASPWMPAKDVSKIEATIMNLQSKSLEVLEWGSGGSTLHFTGFMRQNGIAYRWLSLEYNARWYRQVQQEVSNDRCIELALFDVGNDRLRQRYTEMSDYVSYPTTLGRTFDVVVIDGRKRRRCLLEARHLLKPAGVVLLHDAERPHYQCAFSSYSSGKFLTKHLWLGRICPD